MIVRAVGGGGGGHQEGEAQTRGTSLNRRRNPVVEAVLPNGETGELPFLDNEAFEAMAEDYDVAADEFERGDERESESWAAGNGGGEDIERPDLLPLLALCLGIWWFWFRKS